MWEELIKDKDKLNRINETAFNMIDVNDNGCIERNELEEILTLTAEEMNIEKPTKEEVKEIMKWLDPSNKGHLSKDNFLTLVTQVLKLLKQNEEI